MDEDNSCDDSLTDGLDPGIKVFLPCPAATMSWLCGPGNILTPCVSCSVKRVEKTRRVCRLWHYIDTADLVGSGLLVRDLFRSVVTFQDLGHLLPEHPHRPTPRLLRWERLSVSQECSPSKSSSVSRPVSSLGSQKTSCALFPGAAQGSKLKIEKTETFSGGGMCQPERPECIAR